MPARKKSSEPPVAGRKFLRIAQVVVVVAAGALAYFWSHPSAAPVRPIPPAPTATSDQPAPGQSASSTPSFNRHIYSETADAKADVAAALAQAKREHKRVIVDFGGDWCGDCQVLDYYFHQPPNAQLLAQNYVLAHVWVGDSGKMDANQDIAARYGVPLRKGVPALVVLNSDGKTIYAQRDGEFEKMQSMDSASVTEFLNKWKS